MVSNPLPGAGKLARDSVSLAVGGVTTSARIAMKSEELMEETIRTMRAARPVIDALGRALDAGLDEDVRRLLQTAGQTQEDIRAAREAVERLVGIINSTLDGVGGVPGAQLILKGVARVAGGTKSAIPVVFSDPGSDEPKAAKVSKPAAAGAAAAKAAAKVAAAAPKRKPGTPAAATPAKKSAARKPRAKS